MSNTKQLILEYIQAERKATVKEIVNNFSIERRMAQYHLKSLLEAGLIRKQGKVPKVYYLPRSLPEVVSFVDEELEGVWLTVTSDGQPLPGMLGFTYWCERRGLELKKASKDYRVIRAKYEGLRAKQGWLEVTAKFTETFRKPMLEKVFYGEVFAYERFGKTKWGQLVWYAKLAEDLGIMNTVFQWAGPLVESVVDHYKIDAIAFVPHSLPRKYPFLPRFRNFLQSRVPEVELIKISGDIPIAQKTLKSTEERRDNAVNTIFLGPDSPSRPYKRLLLIDDAVGSGATLQESARKIKQKGVAEAVYGFAMVGSIKGFEVMNEV